MSTCMTHPPVTQPGPADGLAIWLNTQESDTPKQSQGRGILETLDPMPAFTNRARKRAIALRKHPSGKLHLIITGNCVIKLESRTEHKKSAALEECYLPETAGGLRWVSLDSVPVSPPFPSHAQLSRAKVVGPSSLFLRDFRTPDTPPPGCTSSVCLYL